MGARLVELHVVDLGVIDDATVAFGPGMTALTGETGAGKTLLVGALGLLLGGRADPGLVRSGADRAAVAGRFEVGDPGGTLTEVTLERTVLRGGRSRAAVDGRPVTVAALGEVAAGLLELHGQHLHRALVRADAQRDALDRVAGVDPGDLADARRAVRALEAESAALGGDADGRARQADLLAHQAAEIEDAAVEDGGEDGRLAEREERLAEATALRAAAAAALDRLAGDEGGTALDRLAEASGDLGHHRPLADLAGRLRSVMAELGDVATELRSVVDTWEDDPEALDAIRVRRALLHDLARKYGPTLDDVLASAASVRARLDELAALEARAAEVDRALDAARDRLAAVEARVAAARRAAAPRLAAAVESGLHRLAMGSARFQVTVEGPGAADRVVFELAANPGEPAQPLARAASGGELARTMLAVRLALAEPPGVVVFDEVDAGVGGEAATAVGAALAELGRSAQVLVVTHLAQVAAQADRQLAVRKVEAQGRTRSVVAPLTGEERVVELSRMLSGSPDSASARDHARELLGRHGAR